jgi:hypothetical protein
MTDAGVGAGATASAAGRQRYWLWVTGPDYYLDEDGADRRELDPAHAPASGDWWTCHRETQKGDLVLLYRSQIKKDIAYLIEATSEAYPIRDDEWAAEQDWDFGCNYKVIEKFRNPLRIADMRSDPKLGNWGPLRANFRRRAYEVPPDILISLFVSTTSRRPGIRPQPGERIILCYSRGDLEAVRNLYRKLRADGFYPWLDVEDLLPGQNWRLEIQRAMRAGRAVLVCLSASSVMKRGNFQREIKFALDVADEYPEGANYLIPVRLEPRLKPGDVPSRLRSYHLGDLFTSTGYDLLLQALRHPTS